MFQILKFNTDNIFFTSDAHLGQSCSAEHWKNKELWRTRGYSSPEEHIEGYIDIFNKTVNDESVVVHIGDLFFECNSGAKFLSIIPRLKFKTLILGAGNHNASQKQVYFSEIKRLYPELPEGLEVYPLKSNLIGREIIFMPVYFELQVAKDFICCNHYPQLVHNKMGGNGSNKRSIFLTAHSHGSCPLTNLKGKGRRLDCGFDVHHKPISISEIRHILKNRDLDCCDHHGETH